MCNIFGNQRAPNCDKISVFAVFVVSVIYISAFNLHRFCKQKHNLCNKPNQGTVTKISAIFCGKITITCYNDHSKVKQQNETAFTNCLLKKSHSSVPWVIPFSLFRSLQIYIYIDFSKYCTFLHITGIELTKLVPFLTQASQTILFTTTRKLETAKWSHFHQPFPRNPSRSCGINNLLPNLLLDPSSFTTFTPSFPHNFAQPFLSFPNFSTSTKSQPQFVMFSNSKVFAWLDQCLENKWLKPELLHETGSQPALSLGFSLYHLKAIFKM